jgi:hypothetical protein
VDIAHQSYKVLHRIDWLTPETVLEKMTVTLILLIEKIRISNTQSFYDRADVLFLFTDQKVYMIAHQAIGINGTEGIYSNAILVISLCKPLKADCHLKIIFIILKNVLLVDSTKHDMINAGSALCPFLSRHVLMLSCLTAQI